MKVIATKTGFDGQKVREEGEEFDMPKDAKGSWFSPVAAPVKAKGRPAGTDTADTDTADTDPSKNPLA